jgi:hypothetical protein
MASIVSTEYRDQRFHKNEFHLPFLMEGFVSNWDDLERFGAY